MKFHLYRNHALNISKINYTEKYIKLHGLCFIDICLKCLIEAEKAMEVILYLLLNFIATHTL